MLKKVLFIVTLSTVFITGGISESPKEEPIKQKLKKFSESNFDVNFSYPEDISILYNPHGGAARVDFFYAKKYIGILLISSLPKSINQEMFINQGKKPSHVLFISNSV